jgi:small subunit ribosomal protein S6
MRRYELMLVLRPDLAEDRIAATIDRVTRSISGSGGQIVKVSPWGRRRLAYAIGQHREGSYHIVVFDAPPDAIVELERGLHITEEVMRHLVVHVERPSARRAAAAVGLEDGDIVDLAPPGEDLDDVGEFIDESETEAAPAAID